MESPKNNNTAEETVKIKNHLWTIIYGLCLIFFTTYVMLDAFVIPRVYQIVDPIAPAPGISTDSDTSGNNSSDTPETVDTEPDWVELTETSYTDENISITISEYFEYDSVIYVADIQLSSPAYLKTAFAKNSYGKNVTDTTTSTAENNDAIIAINGDYYGARNSGYVLRNGILYRDNAAEKQEDLVIWKDGSFSIITETHTSAEKLVADGAQQIFSFGPALILNSQNVVNDLRETAGHSTVKNPRTAIGIVDDLHYVFVVVDGRTKESAGVTLYELAAFMDYLCAHTAYNLDGGGSATFYFNGERLNNPTTDGVSISERSVSDIVYIGY